MSRVVRRIVLAVAAMAAGASGVAGAGAASAVRTGSPGVGRSLPVFGLLAGVAATSARNAWAIGCTGCLSKPATLILHWNGTAWQRVPSPKPPGATLYAVAATSGTNAWAVGRAGGR